jgi:DNA-binding winged helix-turn-helix (wHTH) protein/TolB-like protein
VRHHLHRTLVTSLRFPTMESRNLAEPLPKAGSGTAFPAEAAALRFGEFVFDLGRGELKGRSCARIPLRPKVEALLRTFLASPGLLLNREALMQAVWPSTVVTDDSLVQCVGELRAALDDHGQLLIRTVPRRGYRFEADVVAVPPLLPRVRGTEVGTASSPTASPASSGNHEPSLAPTSRMTRLGSTVVTTAVVVALLIGVLALGPEPAETAVHIDEEMASRSTVAVLPFTASAGDAEARALGDLFADAVTAQFAARKGMRGLGRSVTGPYAGAPLDRLAAELKASLLVTGQVARVAEDRVAVDVQLVSIAGGGVIWSRHWDAAPGPASQAELGQLVVNAVRNREVPATLNDPSWAGTSLATRQTVIGWAELSRYQSLDDLRRARARFEEALRVDPASVIASNGLAGSYARELRSTRGAPTSEQLARYERIVEHARRLAPDDPTALLAWGDMQILRGRPDLAIPAIEKSISIVPSYPNSYVLLARAKLLSGRAAEVQGIALKAIERGEGDPKRVSSAYLLAAEAALLLGADDNAAAMAKRSIAEWPFNVDAHAVLAATEALAGRDVEARNEMAEVRRRNPDATLLTYAARHRSDDSVYLAQRTRLFDGLLRAGLPAE